MQVNIDISKFKVLDDFFKDLSVMDQKKIFISAYRKAAKPLVQASKTNVPKRTGKLFRSIGTVENPNEISILVGAKLAGLSKNKGWHGHFTENGTAIRIRKKGNYAGKSTGRVDGVHWFERAFEATSEKMYDTIASEWYNEIDRVIQKTVKTIKP